MVNDISNLVFEGGGVLGIAYLGVLDYLFQNDLMKNVKRTAGTSAGAIAACITSFHLPFEDIKIIADSLDYSKVPYEGEYDNNPLPLPTEVKNSIEPFFGDINCLYRLVTSYGWFSSEYFYEWLKKVIANQFNPSKRPPYTFQDFKTPSLHKDNRSFYDLFIIGTNLTTGSSNVFSYETTPTMEVANAVRISMSIPLFFEAIKVNQSEITGNALTNVYCDGGVMNNYPIKLFDSLRYNPNLLRGVNMDTLGARFMSKNPYLTIDNLLEYIWSLIHSYNRIQQEAYYSSPMDRIRSINIYPMDISPIDFNIHPNDKRYRSLYYQGYSATEAFFSQ
ncbi:MAG: patatin-like phospholipase family protein [Herbinix sp.]|jgi:NTE family protein|nr:patatin-like phospholipase family protein [Herbinix sp.]